MAAGKSAVPLAEENSNWAKEDLPRFVCNSCGTKGDGHELLCEEDSTTLWCPNCRLADWVWD